MNSEIRLAYTALATLVALTLPALCAHSFASQQDAPIATGSWRAWVRTPGGDLPFRLDFEAAAGTSGLRAWMVNGPERLEFPVVEQRGQELTLRVDYYDSTITARIVDNGTRLEGIWSKRRSAEETATLEFGARAGFDRLFEQIKPERGTPTFDSGQIDGRWRVLFKSDPDAAIGVFSIDADGAVLGTFLTPTGDYRYLAGVFDGSRLRLSCFDGAHAFLFDARVVAAKGQAPPTLEGDFYSGAHWHDPWTAARDAKATLPDAWSLTSPVPGIALSSLSFTAQNGSQISLDDPSLTGKARIIEVFGTWCPNCFDATHYLKELHDKYASRGLSIVGLAFEVTGGQTRDLRQVKTYIERTEIPWPVLLAGRANKAEASAALPLIDRVRSYPTFVFIDASGRVRAVYTGFSGPATGDENRRLREKFERLIENMLGA